PAPAPTPPSLAPRPRSPSPDTRYSGCKKQSSPPPGSTPRETPHPTAPSTARYNFPGHPPRAKPSESPDSAAPPYPATHSPAKSHSPCAPIGRPTPSYCSTDARTGCFFRRSQREQRYLVTLAEVGPLALRAATL